MIRTTPNRLNLVFALLLALGMAGCGRAPYAHRELGLATPEAVAIAAAAEAIRGGGQAGLDDALARFAAPGLEDDRRAALRALFAELVAAAAVELTDLDQFGGQVFRASFELTSAGASRELHVLLVKIDGQLRWAGMN